MTTGKDDCIFCKIARKEIPAKIVFEDPRVLAFEDINPKAPVHLLLIPKEHVGKVSELTDSNSRLISDLVMAANRIAGEAGIRESGYRLVFNCNKDAGQEVFHLHMHLLGGRRFSWPPG